MHDQRSDDADHHDPSLTDITTAMAHARRVRIPQLFRPTFGIWFERCLDCACELAWSDPFYFVIKHVKQGEVLYEMALCEDCMVALQGNYSPESRRHLDALFVDSGWYAACRQRLTDERVPAPNLEDWLATCALTGRPRADDDAEHQVIGLCVGHELVLSVFPYYLNAEALELVVDGISQATLDSWDRFVGDHLGLPPELRSLCLP